MLYVLWKHPSPGMWNQERCQNALARGLEPGDTGEHRSQELALCIRAKGCIQLDALVCEMDQMVNPETFGGISKGERERVLSTRDNEECRDRAGEPRTEPRKGSSLDQCSVTHPVWQ